MFSKLWFLKYGPTTLKQIRMQDSFNHNISQKTSRMKLDMIRRPRVHQILVGRFKWVSSGMPEHVQRNNKW